MTPVEFILMIVVLYQGVTNYLDRKEYRKERKELIDKIMSRDYNDYATGQYAEGYNQVQPAQPTEEELLAEKEYREQYIDRLPVD